MFKIIAGNKYHGDKGISVMRGSKDTPPSPLRNIYKIDDNAGVTREIAISKFAVYFAKQMKIKNSPVYLEVMRICGLARKGDVTLVCCCKPKPCHIDIIKAEIERILAEEQASKPAEKTIVFVSGSITINSLDKNILSRLDNIRNLDCQIILGDANGVDRQVQTYLLNNNAENVTVYCSGDSPRNNIGNWPTKNISTLLSAGTREFFTAKDLQMAEDCNYALMIWDSKSTGTLSNIIELFVRKKISLVYLAKSKEFLKIKEIGDIENLVTRMAPDNILLANKKIDLTEKIKELKFFDKQVDMFSID